MDAYESIPQGGLDGCSLEAGRTELCSGTDTLSGERGAPKMREVEVLRAYRDGTIERITNPWHFSDNGWICALDHQMEGIHMHFN
jgi:hypothetical protein